MVKVVHKASGSFFGKYKSMEDAQKAADDANTDHKNGVDGWEAAEEKAGVGDEFASRIAELIVDMRKASEKLESGDKRMYSNVINSLQNAWNAFK